MNTGIVERDVRFAGRGPRRADPQAREGASTRAASRLARHRPRRGARGRARQITDVYIAVMQAVGTEGRPAELRRRAASMLTTYDAGRRRLPAGRCCVAAVAAAHRCYCRTLAALSICAAALAVTPAEAAQAPAFDVVVLGGDWAVSPRTTSSFLIIPRRRRHAGIALDAGTLPRRNPRGTREGARSRTCVSTTRGDDLTPEGRVLQHYIRRRLVTHAHLDHVTGLILNSTDDTRRNTIVALPRRSTSCTARLQLEALGELHHRGTAPALSRHTLQPLASGRARRSRNEISRHGVSAEPRRNVQSRRRSSSKRRPKNLLYLGDTGPDAVKGRPSARALWTQVAPLRCAKKLRAIFLRRRIRATVRTQAHGHLTPPLDQRRARRARGSGERGRSSERAARAAGRDRTSNRRWSAARARLRPHRARAARDRSVRRALRARDADEKLEL